MSTCYASLAPLTGFNVDVTWSWVTPKGGPSVVSSLLHQDPSTNQTWLLVTSLGSNGSADALHRCSLNLGEILCQPVEHVLIPKGKHQGVTIVQNHHGVLICLQVATRKRHSLNPELTGTCSLLAPNLTHQAQAYFSNLENVLHPDVHVNAGDCYRNKKSSMEGNKNSTRWRRAVEEKEEEEEAGTEIAIILDGSGSISPSDFQKAKDFISNMMRDIYEKCFECSFALVQYGGVIQTEFDLQDSKDVMASLTRVQKIVQVGNVTKTASAMQHVLNKIFTPTHGSKKKATKVMVVLTDGDIFMDPLNLSTVISSPEMQGVERFAIGVGDAFEKDRSDRELKLIASDPDETHAFKVTNYSALDGLLSKLQQRIIHMEGAGGDALHYQLAQVGFSAQILDKGQVLLGAVGAFDWSGGVLLYNMSSHEGHFLKQTAVDPKAAQNGYLGYSLAVLHRACGLSYVAGAPKHKQHGTVFELLKNGTEANFLPVLQGEQMGSYFGSELCPVDIDMDGTTDFLLVAAPFYHIHKEEGRVYVYNLSKQNGSFSLAQILSGHPEFTDARFGFAMAAIGDISQDQLTDVAIGAPLEGFRADDGASFGSVYIYNGRQDGLSANPSQRIRASAVALGLRYFGMTVAGSFDFSGDGLADITVCSLGQAAVLRSLPVVNLKVSMHFTPEALPIGFSGTVDVRLCFEISSGTPATETGLRETSLNFTLDVDVMKQRKRLKCSDVQTCLSTLRVWNRGSLLCEDLLFLTEGEPCEEDCFSNITVNVSYQLQTPKIHSDHPHPVLDLYAEPSAIFQLSFLDKACKNKGGCIQTGNLFICSYTLCRQKLVVGLTKEVTMNMSVTNAGEDSYMTILTLTYPKNLEFKRIQKPPSPSIQCDDPEPAASILVMNMSCKIGHPVYKRSSVNILVVWQLEEKAFPSRTADITVMITSSNVRSPDRKNHTLEFKHAFIAVLPKPSVIYVNTSQRRSDHKEFLFNIHGENFFGAEFQLQICVPIKIHGLQVIRVKEPTRTQVSLVVGDSATRPPPRLTYRAAAEVGVVRVVRNDTLRGAAVAGVTATAAAAETLPVLRREPLSDCPSRPPPRPPATGSPIRSEEPAPGSRERSRHSPHPPSGSNANTNGTVCPRSRKRVCGSDRVQYVEEWLSVSCAITSDKENVTVAAELYLSHFEQLLRDVSELQILGEISFNKSLYEGLNTENHRTKITVTLLKDEKYYFLPVIIGSSVGGLLVLIVIIVILFKCGFFKRKYRQLNLDSMRRAQLMSEDLLKEDDSNLLPHPLGETVN
ncbi:integrin alpha-E [Orycteropus afer afer]|uniref:Integrin alpha-E n=1 Tax=Orycteropus afer afer TaxID=1230840 RepID=A0AC54Z9B7_ORYAF|nr:integrin alpha-E [Orycteropus afer afer]